MPPRPQRKRATSKHHPASGVHPVIARGSLLLLAADVGFATWLAKTAQPYGHVIATNTVYDALKALPPSGHWAAVLLDVTAPDGSGFTVLDALRVVDVDVPALLLSEAEGPSLGNLAFEKRASLLSKPVSERQVRIFLESPLVRMHEFEGRQRRISLTPPPGLDAALLGMMEVWRDRHRLTSAEAEVLHLALQRVDRSELADRRGVTEATIKTHVNRLLSKTACASLAEVVAEAMREILVDGRRESG